MANREEIDKLVAVCSNCGAVYAARQWPDGEIQAIGSNGCQCGSDEFDPVDEFESGSSLGSLGI